ncbi:MAG: hypothetical protein WCV00_23210 [Verrucomicrobiia bacterium]
MKMLRCSAIFGSLVAGALAAALGATVALTSNDIVRMSKAGISDDAIIQTIQSTGSSFYLTAQDVESLKRDGVSDRIVTTMQATRPPAPSSAAPAEPAVPAVRVPSGRDYVGGLSDQQIVRALPVAPPVYYAPPPPTTYYYYPYYYPPPSYYCGPPVRFYFGYGGWHHRRW